MKPNLAQSAARGLVWSVGGQGAVAILQTITYSVLARLILPEDFGLVAMILAIVSVGEIFRDFGLTSAAIQAPTLSRDEQTNLFWVNIAIGGLLAALLWFSAEAIAAFYSNDELVPVSRVLAATFLINGLAAQPRANLTRNLSIRQLAIADVTGIVVGMIVAISAAAMGFGYWSIVAMQLCRLATVALLMMTFARFIPSLPKFRVSIRPLLRFGGGLLGTQTMILLGNNMPTILIGRSLGPVPLGFFSRAQNLATTPLVSLTPALKRVTLPVLSRLQNDTPRYNAYLLRGQTALLLVSTVGHALLFVYADVVIRIFLGTDWDPAILPFRILCLAGITDATHYLMDWIFTSRGNTSQYFRFAVITRILMILAIAVASRFGIAEVAWAITLWSATTWPIGLWMAHRLHTLPVREMLAVTGRVYLLGALLIAAGAGVRWAVRGYSLPLEIGFSLLAACVAGLLMLIALPRFRQDVLSVLEVAKMMRNSGNT